MFRWSFVDVPLIFSCPADCVQYRIGNRIGAWSNTHTVPGMVKAIINVYFLTRTLTLHNRMRIGLVELVHCGPEISLRRNLCSQNPAGSFLFEV